MFDMVQRPDKDLSKLTPLERALEQFVWDKVTWTFTIKPDGEFKEGRIRAEWPGSGLADGFTTIFNTRDAEKMTMFEWIQFNQEDHIKNIIKKLEVKYKDANGVYINGVWYAHDSPKPHI
jgi:hypothetical protein